MRINLLREREPFSDILESTLTHFFRVTQGGDWSFTWNDGRPKQPETNKTQLLVNEYLNIIFHPSLSPAAFDPIVREYSRSTNRWRRPLQRVYVNSAMRRPLSSWFAHATVTADRDIPRLARLLIIPGNQKLRVLDHDENTCTSIVKRGFRKDAFESELAAREVASKIGIPVPETLSADIEHGVLKERYLSGTPLNRLSDPQQALQRREEAIAAVGQLSESTRHTAPIGDHVDGLISEIKTRMNPYEAHNPQVVGNVIKLVAFLRSFVEDHAPEQQTINLSLTHGDFQPANILVNDDGLWIIDWENSRERQSGYDWLVLETNTRQATSVSNRVRDFINSDLVSPPEWTALELSTRDQRAFHMAVFLLEELAAKANEVSHPAIAKLGGDFLQLVHEVALWQRQEQGQER